MAKLIYATLASLDGYVNDEHGRFDWAFPDDEVHAFFNDLTRSAGTHLYGRRMYEVMHVWDGVDADGDERPVIRDFAAIWQAADKVVYSSTLEEVSTARTRIERSFDPEAVRRMKDEAAADLSIGGPTLARAAFAAGLVDEIHLVLAPVSVGGGTAALPTDLRVDLEPRGERRFAGGMVHLHYACRLSG
jgi:dihydrofolate reductase